METEPLFTLILATYGRVEEVGRMVDSLIAQRCQDFELIVADQNLDDRMQLYVKRACDAGIEVRHLHLVKPNLSAARNAGLAIARGRYVCFPDDDCWYEPELLAVIAGLVAREGAPEGLVTQWVEFERAHPQDQSGRDMTSSAWRRYRGGDASSITLFVRTDLARKVGGFDPRMGVGQWFGAAEEIDFVMSLLAQGARFQRARDAKVHHAFTVNPRDVPVSKLWRQSLSRARGTGAVYAKQRLPLRVILRGLMAPMLRGFLSLRVRALVAGLATSRGRWQGWRSWR